MTIQPDCKAGENVVQWLNYLDQVRYLPVTMEEIGGPG